MLSSQEIIEQLYKSADFTAALSRAEEAGLSDDLKQEVFLKLLELPEERIQAMYSNGQLRWYTARIMVNMVSGKNMSIPFSKTYLRPTAEILGDEIDYGTRVDLFEDEKTLHDQSRINHMKAAIKTLTDYEWKILLWYIRKGNVSTEVAKITMINKRTVQHTIQRIRKKVRTLINELERCS